MTIRITQERLDKGKLLMSGLAEEINGLWLCRSRAEGILVPGARLDITDESIQDLLNWLRRALTTIRSLDLEVYEESDRAAYRTARETDPRGVAVRGLTAPRNNAVHHPEVVDPGVDRAMGPLDDGRFVIDPVWVMRTSRLDTMFTDQKGRFNDSYAEAYDDRVAGRSLTDPLLDAFAFFHDLAPDLARRNDEGNLRQFPLPPLPIAAPYVYSRLDPSWPTESERRDELQNQLRSEILESPPSGLERQISGAIRTEDGHLVLTGMTVVSSSYGHQFLETPEQVIADIRRGYRYVLSKLDGAPSSESSRADLVQLGTELKLPDGTPLPVEALLHAERHSAEIWLAKWELCQKDAAYYARFRKAGS